MPEHKILLLASYRRGGVENFCQMLMNHLCSDFYAELLEVANQPGKNLIVKFLDVIHTVYRLIKQLKIESYDIIHINPSFKIKSLLRDSFYLWIINTLGYRNRTVVFFHGWDENLAEKIIRRPFYKRKFSNLYREVVVIFVLYKRCKKQLVNMGIEPQKIKVTTTMYERIDGIEKKWNHQTNEKMNLLFMATFIEGKGVLTAVKVAKLLSENGYDNFHLTLAGEGPLLLPLKQFIEENELSQYVDIPGYVKDRQKEEILKKNDIFLFPTQLPEGCPTVIIEAMGAGMAVVSTAKGAIPALVKPRENGFICDGQDADAFYKAVKELLDNRELLNQMQKANRKKAEENYEAKDCTSRVEKIYSSIINQSKLCADRW